MLKGPWAQEAHEPTVASVAAVRYKLNCQDIGQLVTMISYLIGPPLTALQSLSFASARIVLTSILTFLYRVTRRRVLRGNGEKKQETISRAASVLT